VVSRLSSVLLVFKIHHTPKVLYSERNCESFALLFNPEIVFFDKNQSGNRL
jgi:hypothetical protein